MSRELQGAALVWTTLVAVLLTVLGASPASANGIRTRSSKSSTEDATALHTVLLLPLESKGLLAADHDALEAKLRPAFEHPAIELTTLDAKPKPCADELCLRTMGRERGASHVVRVELNADGRDYAAQIVVLAVDDDAPASMIDASCSICGLDEFSDRLAARTVAARERILATPRVGRLQVVGQPSNARVRIDGNWRGRLPYAGELAIGEHELLITAPGHFRETLPLATVAGVKELIEVELEPKPVIRWHRGVGWTALVGGAASLGTGVGLIRLDGQLAARRCNSNEAGVIDGDGDCRWLNDTLGLGVGLTIAGVALATTGITLLAIDARRRRAHDPDRAARLAPQVRGGVGIGRLDLQVRF